MNALFFKIVMMIAITQYQADKLQQIADKYNSSVEFLIKACFRYAIDKYDIVEEYIAAIEEIEKEIPYY